MLIQIPQPRAYIHQGATVQPTFPVPPVAQPDLTRAFEARRQQLRYVVDARSAIDQGATVMRTDPVPPQGQLSIGHHESKRQTNRFVVAAVPRFDGATVQPTFPVPPVSQPLVAEEAKRQSQRLQMPAVPRFDGATVQQTHPILIALQPRIVRTVQHPFPQPPIAGASAAVPDTLVYATATPLRTMVRVNGYVTPRFDGATVQDSLAVQSGLDLDIAFLYPGFVAREVVLPPVWLYQGPTVQATHPTPGVSQPTADWFARKDWARRLGGPAPQADQGATVQQTHPTPAVSGPGFDYWTRREWARRLGDRPPQVDQVTATNPDTLTYAQSQPVRLVLVTRADLAPRLEGATIQGWFIYPTNQPELQAFVKRDWARRLGGPTAQVDAGATIQQGYVFPVSQPELRFYPSRAHRYLPFPTPPQPVIVVVDPRYDLYPASQPDLTRFAALHLLRYQVAVVPRVDGATVQDWFLYPPNQPELIRVALKEWARRHGGPVPQFEGATVQQTFPVPGISGPDIARVLALRDYARRLGGPTPILESQTPPDTFLIPGISQPELIAFARKDSARRLGGPTVQVDQGPTQQATFIFPPNQPELQAFSRQPFVRVYPWASIWGYPTEIPAPAGPTRIVTFVSYVGPTAYVSYATDTAFVSFVRADLGFISEEN